MRSPGEMGEDRIEIGRTEEGVEVGRRVRLPRGAQPPYAVFLNGVRQSEGPDYRVEGREIVFNRPIVKEGKVSGFRWMAMFLGLFGTYRKHEVVDVEYRRAGKVTLAHDLEVIPERGAATSSSAS
jgi:hypothetical protein